jgi:hypothetical protein
MDTSDQEDKASLAQNIAKQRMGDRELQRRAGKPPRKGDADVSVHDPDVKEMQRNNKHGTDPDETYRTGRQGPK